MTNLTREPYAAGKFYPAEEKELEHLFSHLIQREKSHINYKLADNQIIGAVLPHAGYIYSGYQAIHFFEIASLSEQNYDVFIIIHPIHRGLDYDYATDEYQKWTTPLGDMEIDRAFSDAMNIPRSASFHANEHSCEVMLPFIRKYFPYVTRFVPIGIGNQDPGVAREIAGKITEAAAMTGKRVCVIASSDFSHYVSPDYGRKMDQKVINRILDFDTRGVYDEVMKNDITVCGYGPVMTLMEYSLMNFSGIKAEVIARGHSGEVYPSSRVVDYVSILFYLEKKQSDHENQYRI